MVFVSLVVLEIVVIRRVFVVLVIPVLLFLDAQEHLGSIAGNEVLMTTNLFSIKGTAWTESFLKF